MKVKRSALRHGAIALVFAMFFAFVGAGTVLAAQAHMDSALSSLQTALSELNQADADKGGHRANAIKLVKEAITEVNAGIQAGK
ncbi:MAG TPA: hypothetical protein VHR97_02180 [Candidatus Baltobacteraceae bacterium]|jgi:hypothetical protein|nr:hypothetical protein [Candidatus Baltobacteraceae bacterium]